MNYHSRFNGYNLSLFKLRHPKKLNEITCFLHPYKIYLSSYVNALDMKNLFQLISLLLLMGCMASELSYQESYRNEREIEQLMEGLDEVITEAEKSVETSQPEPIYDEEVDMIIEVGAESSSENIFSIVEKMPSYPGGQEEMNQFIQENLVYPTAAKNVGIKGRVYVQFVVDKNGNITQEKVIRGIGGGCDEEALKVIRLMPKWIPGEQNGKEVDVKYTLPITFNLK